jgi:hypothetical protein
LPSCRPTSSIPAAIPIPMHSSKEEPCKSMQSIMERRHTDLLDTREPRSTGLTRVKTTSFHTTLLQWSGISKGDFFEI